MLLNSTQSCSPISVDVRRRSKPFITFLTFLTSISNKKIGKNSLEVFIIEFDLTSLNLLVKYDVEKYLKQGISLNTDNEWKISFISSSDDKYVTYESHEDFPGDISVLVENPNNGNTFKIFGSISYEESKPSRRRAGNNPKFSVGKDCFHHISNLPSCLNNMNPNT